ncbi:MAG: hypothetical protein WCI72_05425 [archaeon]
MVITTVTVNPSVVSGSFEINLICENNSVNVYKISPAEGAFSASVVQKINHKIILTKEYIGSLSGDCYIESFLGKETVSSNHFLLTEDISLNAKIDKTAYNPGETVLVSIDAKKANGVLLNGNYEVTSSASFKGKVEKGIASNSFKVDNNASAGKYELVFYVFDSDANGVLNQEKTAVYYEVKQVPTKLEIGLSSFEALPNQNYSFAVDLTDQSGVRMPGSVLVKYISPKNEQNSFSVPSGTSGILNFASNAAPGNYILTAVIGNLSVEKLFSVKAVPNISIVLLEDLAMVSVENIGNVPYEDSLNVTIGNETETLLVKLGLGEEKRYSLRAPTGIYSVIAQIGGFATTKQLSLTGRAVSVGSWTGIGMFEQYPLVWMFISLILIIAAVIIFLKFRHLRTYDYHARAQERAQREMKDEDLNEVSRRAFQKKQFLNLANPIVNEAQSATTVKGNKDLCSVVAVNVKNYATLGMEARNKVNDILSSAKDKFGVMEFRGQHMLIIYSPLVTKTDKNEMIAAKAAWKIKRELDEYNKKFKDKIRFNIGLNSGEMVSSLAGGKLVYTNLGNGVILAKRISDLSEGKVLVSLPFRQKLMRELKINKTDFHVGNSEVMEVIGMSDVDSNQAKLDQILKRPDFLRTE